MAKITVNRLSTTNATPTITGTVEFERFDANKNPKETIQIVINYNTYKLFENGLGIDETKKPTVWKLQIDSPLFPATYDVEANVVDVVTKRILASDDTVDELIIQAPFQATGQPAQPKMSIAQKVALIAGLMNSVNSLFGGQNGIGPLPSVHPTTDDDSSSSLVARGKEERPQDPRVKSQNDTRAKGVTTSDKTVGNDKTSNQQMGTQTVTDAADLDQLANAWMTEGFPTPSDTLTDLNSAMAAVRSAPDLAQDLIQSQTQFNSSTPTTPFG
jgi:hypothetical protein